MMKALFALLLLYAQVVMSTEPTDTITIDNRILGRTKYFMGTPQENVTEDIEQIMYFDLEARKAQDASQLLIGGIGGLATFGFALYFAGRSFDKPEYDEVTHQFSKRLRVIGISLPCISIALPLPAFFLRERAVRLYNQNVAHGGN